MINLVWEYYHFNIGIISSSCFRSLEHLSLIFLISNSLDLALEFLPACPRNRDCEHTPATARI